MANPVDGSEKPTSAPVRCSLNSVINRSLGIQVTADRVTRQGGTCLLLLAL